ncbi:MAG: hypothetical protein WBE68_06415 [Candidatus Nitrosopolaris sp.]
MDTSLSNSTTQTLTEDNNNTSNTPSVIRLSPLILLNNTNTNNNTLSTATSESSNGNNSNSNAFTHDTSSNSVTNHAHYGTGRNQYKDNSNNSHDLTNKIINKSKQKLKVGDIPFP